MSKRRLALCLLVAGIGTQGGLPAAIASGTSPTAMVPLGLPTATIIRLSNAPLVRLGEVLFEDPRLSADGTISCQSCHLRDHAFTDGRSRAVGVNRSVETRNAPSLANVRYLDSFFWDGRAITLEQQAIAPFLNPREKGLTSEASLLDLIIDNPAYSSLIREAFGIDPADVQINQIALALSAYERTLLAGNSPFDRFQFRGEQTALSESAARGLTLFTDRARCASCHLIGAGAALFTDQRFHASPVLLPDSALSRLPALARKIADLSTLPTATRLNAAISEDPDIAALGHYVVTLDPADIGTFRTPSLRNVELTAPYMHDGSVDSLEDAIDLEAYGRTTGASPLTVLTTQDKRDLVEFLRSLTSPID